jgi:hypothetical protein
MPPSADLPTCVGAVNLNSFVRQINWIIALACSGDRETFLCDSCEWTWIKGSRNALVVLTYQCLGNIVNPLIISISFGWIESARRHFEANSLVTLALLANWQGESFRCDLQPAPFTVRTRGHRAIQMLRYCSRVLSSPQKTTHVENMYFPFSRKIQLELNIE